MAYQLSLDSCTKACSVSLIDLDDPSNQFSWFEILDRGHAEIIAQQAQKLMLEANIKAKDFSQIAVTIGPGTFTGARIALSFARMFATARKIPIITVNSLEAIAFNAVSEFNLKPDDVIHAAIDARRGQVYFASYNGNGQQVVEPKAIEISDAIAQIKKKQFVIGTGKDLLISQLADYEPIKSVKLELDFPNAAIFGKVVTNRTAVMGAVSPLYLRAADAKLPTSHPVTFTQ